MSDMTTNDKLIEVLLDDARWIRKYAYNDGLVDTALQGVALHLEQAVAALQAAYALALEDAVQECQRSILLSPEMATLPSRAECVERIRALIPNEGGK